ncbi:MAG: thiosulfate sulfurtransferase GlpE [Gammaproteobacteria bacterium]|nr:thiosulfate sulfurtransferase GlpE [Gammaproteobacteria bacterium]MDH5629683.1 thiosulfate sulfurtransferase GlpE [Gammaproteobacteria bacterium]
MFQNVSVSDAVAMIENEKVNIIDIRDQQSFTQGHIQGAVHIDNNNIQSFIDSADKSLPLLICCYRGNASQAAAHTLYQQGFEKTYSLSGGMCDWVLTQPVI